jgi:carboxyl-terminal processing protease
MRRVAAFAGGLAFGLLTAFLFAVWIGRVSVPTPFVVVDSAWAAATNQEIDVFRAAFDSVRANYIVQPDKTKLVEAAISGMLASLDSHSRYIDATSFRVVQTPLRSVAGSLGLNVTMVSGAIKVVTPIDGAPAAKAGILPDDVLTKFNDQPVAGLTLNQAVEKMRGPVNSSVKLTVTRSGKLIDFVIVRDTVRQQSVFNRMEGDDIGHIRITQFTEQTSDRSAASISDISQRAGDKLKGYIIDLRDNQGGLLDQAVAVSRLFLDKGEIVSTSGRNPQDNKQYRADGQDRTGGKPLAVLINGSTAAGAEIVAGALQDNKRAIIVGAKSAGAGTIQTVIPLEADRGGLRLTTSRFLMPSGRSIEARGIAPDVEIAPEASADPTKDRVLAAALDLLRRGGTRK